MGWMLSVEKRPLLCSAGKIRFGAIKSPHVPKYEMNASIVCGIKFGMALTLAGKSQAATLRISQPNNTSLICIGKAKAWRMNFFGWLNADELAHNCWATQFWDADESKDMMSRKRERERESPQLFALALPPEKFKLHVFGVINVLASKYHWKSTTYYACARSQTIWSTNNMHTNASHIAALG